MAALGFLEAAFDILPEVLSAAGSAVDIGRQLFDSHPAPSPNSDAPSSAQSVIPASATDDTPSLPRSEFIMSSNSSNRRSEDRGDYSAPAIIGKQAIAYDPRQRVPAASFLGHGAVTPLPFSFPIATLEVPSGATWTTTLTVAQSVKAITKLVTLMEPWRFAKLRSLEAIVMPTYYVSQMDFQIDAAWTTDAQPTLTKETIIQHLAHTRIVFAGGVSQASNTVIPAPLGQMNPVVKDSATYNDTPRFNAFISGSKHDLKHDQVPIIDVVIRGVLEVGDISLY